MHKVWLLLESSLEDGASGEKFELYDKPLISNTSVASFKNYSQSIVAEEKRLQKEQESPEKLSPTTTKVIDVFGEMAEPICDYLRCHHKSFRTWPWNSCMSM